MSNPFEDIATQASRPTQRKMAREDKQPMVPSPMQKAIYDRAKQLNLFKKWKRQIREGMNRGDFGVEIVDMLRLLKKLPDGNTMVDWLRHEKQKWILMSPKETRYEILGWFGDAMMRWNIRHGLPHFTDSLPEEPDSPSVKIRKLLTAQGEM